LSKVEGGVCPYEKRVELPQSGISQSSTRIKTGGDKPLPYGESFVIRNHGACQVP